MTQFFLARQPIFTRDMKVFAYELLFRGSRENAHGGAVDDDASTAKVIANAAELGLEKITRGRPAFINLPQRFLEEPELIPLDPGWMVAEILETVTLNDASMQGIQTLRQRGFTIALDDFVDTTSFDAILPLVDIVKIDVLALPPAQWGTQIARLRAHDCRILAEKVETRDAFDALRELGVDYFQGFFFARPLIVEGRQLPPVRVSLLQTLARLNDRNSSVDDIHAVVSRDVALSIKALSYVNSAANGLSRRIESIREALVYLGRDTIRRWVSLYVLASGETQPEEKLTLALQRAKVCELIAERGRHGNPDVCFTTGLFSMLDALMDSPLPDLLRQMNLTEEMRDALLCHIGETGEILACAKSMESTQDMASLKYPHLKVEELYAIQSDALYWTDEALSDLGIG